MTTSGFHVRCENDDGKPTPYGVTKASRDSDLGFNERGIDTDTESGLPSRTTQHKSPRLPRHCGPDYEIHKDQDILYKTQAHQGIKQYQVTNDEAA
jgi:hypothetical protein